MHGNVYYHVDHLEVLILQYATCTCSIFSALEIALAKSEKFGVLPRIDNKPSI